MEVSILSTLFQSTTALVALLIVLLGLWPQMRLDQFRQKMFAVRDELFDYAATGKINLDHSAHRLLRQSMNGFIRYAHQLTFFRIVLVVLIWKVFGNPPELEWTKKWDAALESIEDDQVRKDLVEFHWKASSLVVERIVLGSPLLILVVLVCLGAILLHAGVKSLQSGIEKAMFDTTAKVIDPRLLDEEAARMAA